MKAFAIITAISIFLNLLLLLKIDSLYHSLYYDNHRAYSQDSLSRKYFKLYLNSNTMFLKNLKNRDSLMLYNKIGEIYFKIYDETKYDPPIDRP